MGESASNTALPAPLTPSDCDLQAFRDMPVDIVRLRGSDLVSEQTPEENWAAFMLWTGAWHQVPAASIPNSDKWQAKQAGYMMRGRIDPQWEKVKEGALRGFVLCSDGRLYHTVLAEKANTAWLARQEYVYEKLVDRTRKENKKRSENQQPTIHVPPFEEWLSAGRPPSFPVEDQPPSAGNPPETLLKGRDREGIGNGRDRETIPPTSTGTGSSPDGDDDEQPPPGQGGQPFELTPAGPQEAPGPVDENRLPACPHQAILKLWAEVLPAMPQHDPDEWRGRRRDDLQLRWREKAAKLQWASQADGLRYFRRLFAYVAKSEFLTGRAQGDRNRRPFRIELQWLVRASHWADVVEGKYHEDKED